MTYSVNGWNFFERKEDILRMFSNHSYVRACH